MKSVRFSKVVAKSGKPEVYLLMSETDSEFHKALDSDKIMSLSDESHGSGTDYGTVGYDKKRHGQLLIFPKTLKSFAGMKIVGIKYDMFAEDPDNESRPRERTSEKKSMKPKATPAKPKLKPQKEKQAKKRTPVKKKADAKPEPKKVIPFPEKRGEDDDDDDAALKADVRQAMRALEKGNSVAAYNILKRIVP